MLLQSSRVGSRIMLRRQRRGWTLAATLATIILSCAQGAETVPKEASQPSAERLQTPWAPKLYPFCMEVADAKRRSLLQEARMLRKLGFDGVGYLLWLDEAGDAPVRRLGEDLDANLRTLDEAGLPLFATGASVNVNPSASPYDPRLVEAIRKLKGRPLTIDVMLKGFPPGDERAMKPAAKILRRLGDLAAKSGLRVSIYHHEGDWTASFIHTLRVVEEVNHPCVGANFNLPHWLAVDGDKDYRPHLRAGADKIFVVTICGSKVGGKTVAELVQPLDQGDFDNRKLLSTLCEIGYRGPIGLQCYGIPGDAHKHLQRSMKVWKAWEAEWAKRSP